MSTAAPEPLPEYAWPPLPVLDVDEAAEILAQRLGAAWDDLEAERVAVLTTAGLLRVAEVNQWIGEFQGAVVDFVGRVTGEVATFIEKHLGPRYAQAARAVNGQHSWTTIHVTALQALATDTYADFLARSREAQRVSEKFVRTVRKAAALEVPKIAAGGRTATQVGDRLATRLLTEGVDHVTYRDGSRVDVRAYSRMVARTKSRVAYNAGTLTQASELGFGYVEVFDGPDCGWSFHEDPERANGTVRTLADAAVNAISHPNCVAEGSLVEALGSLQAGYRTRYAGPMVRLRTSGGRGLTVTPHHPVLTSRGWVDAAAIEVGDEVVGYDVGAHGSGGTPDLNQRPAPVEDVVDSLRPAGSASSVVPAAADFHGDAAYFQAQVEVVDAEPVLGHDVDATGSEGTGEGQLCGRGADRGAVAGSGPSLKGLPGVGRAPAGGVRGVDGRRVVLPGAKLDARLSEALTDEAIADADLCGELGGRLPGDVSLEQVVEVRDLDSWGGHVYDLSTGAGAYWCEGILVHNCRRSFGVRPDVTTDEEAAAARPSTTPGQVEDQREADRLAAASRVRAARPRQAQRARRQAARAARAGGAQGATDGDVIRTVTRSTRPNG